MSVIDIKNLLYNKLKKDNLSFKFITKLLIDTKSIIAGSYIIQAILN